MCIEDIVTVTNKSDYMTLTYYITQTFLNYILFYSCFENGSVFKEYPVLHCIILKKNTITMTANNTLFNTINNIFIIRTHMQWYKI